MGEDCNNCVQGQLLEKLTERVDKLEAENKELTKRVVDLERKTDVGAEQTKMIFKMLAEIKDSIDRIGDKLEKIEQEPGDKWKEMSKIVIGLLVTAAVSYFLGGRK